jgi:antitoxin component YwqK of YwqJK toxin-antitoxin module
LDDKLNGKYVRYYDDDETEETRGSKENFNYLNGKLHGEQIVYHMDENNEPYIGMREIYENGELKKTLTYFENGNVSYIVHQFSKNNHVHIEYEINNSTPISVEYRNEPLTHGLKITIKNKTFAIENYMNGKRAKWNLECHNNKTVKEITFLHP